MLPWFLSIMPIFIIVMFRLLAMGSPGSPSERFMLTGPEFVEKVQFNQANFILKPAYLDSG